MGVEAALCRPTHSLRFLPRVASLATTIKVISPTLVQHVTRPMLHIECGRVGLLNFEEQED